MILIELQGELAEEFSPSLTNPSGKALKDVDMYDFLDYFIRVTKHNNNSVQELAQSLQNLREFERGKMPLNTESSYESSIMSKTNLREDKMAGYAKNLTPQQIQEAIQKWDLSPQTNAKSKQRIIVENISNDELAKLQTEFNFKSKKPIVREIDSHQVIHTLREHGDEANETMRGQIAVTMNDIANYRTYTQEADLRTIQENRKIVYAKQVNGHFVVIEEAFEAQDKLRFFDMWKGKGKINKEVLLAHSQRPKHEPKPKS